MLLRPWRLPVMDQTLHTISAHETVRTRGSHQPPEIHGLRVFSLTWGIDFCVSHAASLATSHSSACHASLHASIVRYENLTNFYTSNNRQKAVGVVESHAEQALSQGVFCHRPGTSREELLPISFSHSHDKYKRGRISTLPLRIGKLITCAGCTCAVT